MRLWGSVAFIAVSLASGRMVGTWGEALVPWIILILLGLNVLASLLLPIDRPHGGGPRPPGGLLALLRRREVLAFLAAGMLSQAAHGPYYVFYSIHLGNGAAHRRSGSCGPWRSAARWRR
jgi:PPP family 3-phenylpropionic acid transporter